MIQQEEEEEFNACPNCLVGKMELEPKYKHEGVYDVWTCQICEHMEVDYDLYTTEEND